MANTVIMKPIGKAMANPISLAIMITAVVMIIVFYTFDKEHVCRTSLRIFGVSMFFLFMNNHILLEDKHKAELNNDQRNIISALEKGRDTLTPEENIIVPTPIVEPDVDADESA
jgi:hypothetical protein